MENPGHAEDYYFGRTVTAIDDSSYNHILHDSVHFLDVVAKGGEYLKNLDYCDSLSSEQKSTLKNYFSEKLKKIKRSDDGSLDLTHPQTLKTFLAFEKLNYYKGDFDNVMFRENGWFDEKNDILGCYYQDMLQLCETAKKHPQIVEFAKTLYNSEKRFMNKQRNSAPGKRNKYARSVRMAWKNMAKPWKIPFISEQ